MIARLAPCLPASLSAGRAEPTSFDRVVLEGLADSLLAPLASVAPELVGPAAAARAEAGLADLRAFLLATFVRRYLERGSIDNARDQRAAVNSLRLVQVDGWGEGGCTVGELAARTRSQCVDVQR